MSCRLQPHSSTNQARFHSRGGSKFRSLIFVFVIVAVLLPAHQIFAQSANLNGCSNYAPGNGDTVTCSSAYSASTSGVQSTQNSTVTGNNVTVLIDSSAQRSIFGSTVGIGSGGTVTNNGILTTQGAFYSYGISFGANGRSQAGNNSATNNGTITTNSGNSTAIYISATGSNPNSVTNAGFLNTSGAGAYGIFTNTTGGLSTILNNGSITTSGANSHAINADSTTGGNNITNNGTISSSARGINVGSTSGVNNIANGGNVNAASSAIFVNSTIGAININNNSGGSLTSTGSNGINATSAAGGITVNNASGSSISAASYGIYANSSAGGAISVTNNSTIGFGASYGIYAQATTGTVDITNGGVITTNQSGVGTSTGIYAETTTGNISISNTASIGNATNPVGSLGIYGRSYNGGNVSITNSGSIESNFMGLRAANYYDSGNGTINIINSGKIVSHGAEDPIWVESYNGNITIQNSGELISDNLHGLHGQADGSGNVTITNTAAIQSAQDSIIGTSNGGNVSITSSGNLTSTNDDAIYATTNSGGNITINNGGILGANARLGSNGIEATVSGSGAAGAIDVTNAGAISSTASGINLTTVNGNITATNSGAINATASSADGIIANTTGGGAILLSNFASGNITTNHHALHGYGNASSVTISNQATLSSKDTAIFGESTRANADVTVTNSGSVTSSGSDSSDSDGIRVKSKRNASIDNSGFVSAYSSAVNVLNIGSGQTTISNTGSLLGSGASSQNAVIAIDPSGVGNATPTFITNSGVIAPSSGAPGGLSIAAGSLMDGAVSIANSGTVTGRVQLTDNVVAGNFDSFTNSGAWNTSGDNKFFIGADTITNTSTGRINTYGTTNFDMGGQDPVFQNTVTNSGVLKVSNGSDGSAGVLKIFATGNETLSFINTGTIDLSNTNPNDKPNTLIIQGDLYSPPTPGAPKPDIVIDTPTGGTASQIVVDGNASNVQADLTIVPDTVGSNNPIGSAVVSVSGSTAGSSLNLSPNSPGYNVNNGTPIVNAGLYFYYLGNSTGAASCSNGYTCWSLYSVPSAAAKTLPIAVTAAQSLWQETALMWEDRQVELRDSARGRDGIAANGQSSTCDDKRDCGISTWLKSVGSWSNRSNYQTQFGGNGVAFAYDLGYRQNSFGMLGGADWSKVGLLSVNDFFAVGVMGGYLQSNVNVNQEAGNLYGSSNFSYQGGTIGGSVTYMTHGFFADALFKTDLVALNMSLPIGALKNAAVGVRTAGGIGNLGYRYNYGQMFVEPLATVTYSTTGIGSINSLNYQNVAISFGNGNDLRGGFGGRVGTAWANLFTTHILEASLTGRYWNMFNSNGGRTVNILSSGVGDTLGDYTLGRDYGEVKGNLNLFSICSGWSAFVNTGVKWNNQFTTVTSKGGIAYIW